MSHDAAGTDDDIVTDSDPWQNNDARPQPHPVPDRDGVAILRTTHMPIWIGQVVALLGK